MSRIQTVDQAKQLSVGTNGVSGELHKDSSGEELEQRIFEELLQKYDAAICTLQQWEAVEIPKRKFLVGQWMREGDLGFLYGERGGGKTYFAGGLATHLSTGRDLFSWAIPEAADVMYVDGEMPQDDARDRLKGMSPNNPRIHILHHDRLFDQCGGIMNLTHPVSQMVVTAICQKRNIKLLILDNLSCLFSGIKENDADEWEKVLNWLLDLRRRKIAVLIIHHAGASGTRMRGTTRREDAAFWVIRVDPITDRQPNETGARFQTAFTKQRNNRAPEWNREWTFRTEQDGTVSIGCQEISFDAKVLQLVQAGLSSASDIAQELAVAKSTVCKAAKRLEDKNLITINRRQYKPRGFMNEREQTN
jgi:RecA-family ATPase